MSNASHAKEPSMEEILASIRRIIESGDERTSLPGLSLTPRERRGEVREPLPAAANLSPAHAPEQAVGASRLRPIERPEEKTPVRVFQPANVAPAEPDPFEELATWEFSPVEPFMVAAGPTPAAVVGLPSPDGRGDEAMPSARLEPGANPPPVERLAVDDEDDAARPARKGPSLAEAYGVSRAVPDRSPVGSPPAEMEHVSVPQGAQIAARESSDASETSSVLDAGLPDSGAIHAGVDSADVRPVGVRTTAAAAAAPDFSFEFDEDAFSAELRVEVFREGPAAPVALDATAGIDDVSADPAAALPSAAWSSVMTETSSLMSAEAGLQVAAAFDDLARAIRDGHMKSMEEMAREMLRPMLQEWLDDNLPRLVEKLVREEIERVARGGRR